MVGQVLPAVKLSSELGSKPLGVTLSIIPTSLSTAVQFPCNRATNKDAQLEFVEQALTMGRWA
jgi:hypothetical protein